MCFNIFLLQETLFKPIINFKYIISWKKTTHVKNTAPHIVADKIQREQKSLTYCNKDSNKSCCHMITSLTILEIKIMNVQ